MGRRITLRRIGADTGKKAALPATMPDLLEVATTKLQLAAPAKRIFSADGDEYDADDLDLIETDDVLYVSCGEDFVPHAASIEQPPASAKQPPAAEEPPAAVQSPARARASASITITVQDQYPNTTARRARAVLYTTSVPCLRIHEDSDRNCVLNQSSHSDDLCADRVSDRPTAGAACARHLEATDRHTPGVPD